MVLKDITGYLLDKNDIAWLLRKILLGTDLLR